MKGAGAVLDPRRPRFKPIYFLAFSGDLLGSLLIVACVLVGTRLGVDNWIIGVLASSYGISYMFSAAVFGHISDRIGRRKSLLVTCIGFTIVGSMFIAFPSNVPLLILGQLVVGLLYGFWWSSIEAYVSENTTGIDHQRKVNNFCISWSLGYMMGPFIGPLLSIVGSVYSFSILVAFSIINVIVVAAFIAPGVHHPIREITRTASTGANLMGKADRELRLASAILILTIFTYAFTKSFFIGLFPDIAITELGFSELQTSTIGLAFGLTRTLAFLIQNRMRSKSVALRILLALALSGTCFLYVSTTSFVVYIALTSLTGFFSGLVYTSSLGLLLQLNERWKGRVAGFFEASIGIGTFLSPVVGSSILGLGYASAYMLVATLSTVVAALALGLLIVLARPG